jgi:hypothetical protein
VDTPTDAACGAGIVITMLADGEAVAEAMDGPDAALAVMPGANQENGNRTDEPNGPPHAIADRTVWAGQAGGGSRLKVLIETRGDLDASVI